ncbi:MAG: efflux transporter outer membrane subunit, partial [Betaproteobacteria bacterium]|nr:efflux transporter outer membrane subunit [Betaproteobacteria bacterium]
MMKRWYLACVALPVVLNACSFAPEYKRPEAPMASQFKEDGVWRTAAPMDDQVKGDWWHYFNDTVLSELESKLDKANLQLGIALARHDQALAIANENNAQLYPEIDASGNYLTNRQSVNRPLRSSSLNYNVYGNTAIGAGINYELDLWGRLRNQAKSSSLLEQASRADIENVRLSQEALLATIYFELRSYDAQIAIFKDSIKAYDKEFTIIKNRHDEGVVSGLDVARSESLLDQVKGQLQGLLIQRSLFEHALAVLIGENPSTFTLAPVTSFVANYPKLPTVLPSQVLQRRPDIAAAERKVAAANAEIGVAKAAFFPTINLLAFGGYQNSGYGNLLSVPNSYWALGPLAFLPIIDEGRRQSLVDLAEGQNKELVISYRETVLNAFKEVEDSLASLNHLQLELAEQSKATIAAKTSYDIAVNRYLEGANSYLEVIDAENTKLNTQIAETKVKSA